jgi:hypothetical protein
MPASLWGQQQQQPITMSAYITAQSWNGEWFYYNVIQDTWEWSATTTPGTAHHADDNDMTASQGVCRSRTVRRDKHRH